MTDRSTNGRTDRRTRPLIEMRTHLKREKGGRKKGRGGRRGRVREGREKKRGRKDGGRKERTWKTWKKNTGNIVIEIAMLLLILLKLC